MTWGFGDCQYRVVEGWGKGPEGRRLGLGASASLAGCNPGRRLPLPAPSGRSTSPTHEYCRADTTNRRGRAPTALAARNRKKKIRKRIVLIIKAKI